MSCGRGRRKQPKRRTLYLSVMSTESGDGHEEKRRDGDLSVSDHYLFFITDKYSLSRVISRVRLMLNLTSRQCAGHVKYSVVSGRTERLFKRRSSHFVCGEIEETYSLPDLTCSFFCPCFLATLKASPDGASYFKWTLSHLSWFCDFYVSRRTSRHVH